MQLDEYLEVRGGLLSLDRLVTVLLSKLGYTISYKGFILRSSPSLNYRSYLSAGVTFFIAWILRK